MRLAFFEDRRVEGLAPLTLLRPACEVLCGQWSLRERAVRTLGPVEWGLFARPYLSETYCEAHPEAVVNDLRWLQRGPTLLLNSRWVCDAAELAAIRPDETGIVDGEVAFVTVDPAEVPLADIGDTTGGDAEPFVSRVARLRSSRRLAGGQLAKHPWELVEWNGRQLTKDFLVSRSGGLAHENSLIQRERPDVAILGDRDQVHIAADADVEPFVVIDARRGPVTIGSRAIVQAFTRIEGPCAIGYDTQLFRANIRGGTTIGPVCRVGGEVEASILHEHVNKYHDGFLGHSYICPWVNLGAQTANSDLKNDYTAVTLTSERGCVDTGLVKVGCFVGDHTKTGLGSLINTGSVIGAMCMILPAGGLLPRSIPSFASVWHGAIADRFPLERSLAGARAAMERRNVELTPAMERLLRHVHRESAPAREAAIDRNRQRHAESRETAR
jgi:UDP-N-acetylglucosamine diphosphorylase / glucose-1-phosphate thymidylyltransferase / UDP-N-acetylgalactosamine diphosphorylase / glucosamine-1-phosphate N-acetyltransferase / galactosamine-1-phosphate N-acetyltransferase